MLKSILVGLDGSAHSNAAVELGIRWAKRFDALLVGIGVVDTPHIQSSEPVPLGAGAFKAQADEARAAAERRRVEHFLGQFSVHCAEEGVASKVLEESGVPAEQLVLQAQRFDLVMLGLETHFEFGSEDRPDATLHRVLKNSPRPVVAVPAQLSPPGPVMIAYDGSLQAAHAVQSFQSSGLHRDREVHIVSIAAAYGDADRPAERAAEFLRFHGIDPRVHPVVSTDKIARVLLDYANRLAAGLVVMGAYGRSTIREFFLGSITRTMLLESPVPLFLDH